MKTIVTGCLLTIALFAFSSKDELLSVIKEAVQQWNDTKPDKGFLTPGNSIEYGIGYLEKHKYTESLWYFNEVIQKDDGNAWAHLFAATANIGLGEWQKAQDHLGKTEATGTTLKVKLTALLEKMKQDKAEQDRKDTRPQTTTKKPTTKTTNTNTGKTKTGTTESTATGKGGALVYGDYVFTLDQWDVAQKKMTHQQKGFFTLKSDGTYSYMGVTGKYSYNAITGAITWLSGTFHTMGKNTTTFQRNKTTCQVDFTYHMTAGKVYYSGGRNL